MDGEPEPVGLPHQRGRRTEPPVLGPGDDHGLLRAHAVGVARDLAQPLGRDLVRGPDELDQRHPQLGVELLEVVDLEGLHEHLGVAAVQAVGVERAHQRGLDRQAQGGEVGGVLGLRVDADRAAELPGEPARQVDDLLEGQDLVAAVVGGVRGPQLGQPLLGAQGLQLGQGEVLGEPAGHLPAVDGLRGPAVGELRVVGDVGRQPDLVLVPGDQHTVLRGHQVRLDVVRPHPGGHLVGRRRVLRPVARRAAVPDHQRVRPAVLAVVGRAHDLVGRGRDGEAEVEQERGRGGRGESPRRRHLHHGLLLACARMAGMPPSCGAHQERAIG